MYAVQCTMCRASAWSSIRWHIATKHGAYDPNENFWKIWEKKILKRNWILLPGNGEVALASNFQTKTQRLGRGITLMSSKHRLKYMHIYDRYRIHRFLRNKCRFRRTHHCLLTILWTSWDRKWGLLRHKVLSTVSKTIFGRNRGLFLRNMKPLRYSGSLGIFQKFLFGRRMKGNECTSLGVWVLSFSIKLWTALHG